MLWNRSKNFCDINPLCYAISEKKEIAKRHLRDALSKETFASEISHDKLPVIVSERSSHLIKTGPGIDPQLQQNKAVNIEIAARCMNGMLIHPGEVFSFWRVVGDTTAKKGYLDGRTIIGDKLIAGIGGGLCNLSNTLHLLILDSPLDVIEFHSHSDALAPDEGERKPFSTGTSVSYNNIDYRFKNNTDQDVQLLMWCENNELHGQLRSERAFPWKYSLIEEGHHFRREGDKFFRVSKIYRETRSMETGELLKKELVLDNHSEVMFDYGLIPPDQIAPR